MGCQQLKYQNFSFLEIIQAEKRVSAEKKRINYYPFGLKHKGYNYVINGTDHKYGYNGKEEQDELGLQWMDFGFRNYDASLGRWMNIDPLASGYAPISPYAYTANSPIRFIDPDGRKIGDGIDLFNRFRKDVNNKIASTKNTIKNRTNRVQGRIDRAKRKGKDDKAADLQSSLDSRNKADLSTIAELDNVNSELDDLYSSKQVYDIVTDGSSLSDTVGGKTSFNTSTGAVTINIGSSYSSGKAAHEFKHASQFESGALSFDSSGEKGGALWDLVDELEAYSRGTLFGYDLNLNSLTDLANTSNYKSIKDRNTQLTLDSTPNIENAISTNGFQARALSKIKGQRGVAPTQYYKGWRKAYLEGSFYGLLKRL